MEPQGLSARFRYLHNSAHLLVITAPATSKHLMSRSNSLMFDSGIERSDSQRWTSCGACGVILINGWNSTAKIESQRAVQRAAATHQPSRSKAKEIVYECDSCNKITRINVQPAEARKRARPSYSALGPVKSSTQATQPPTKPEQTPSATPANSSSKKRAKARKLGGLEALLANKKAFEARQSGFGLDLMDFMKKS
ncbi:hypothetical protein B0O99DRAFT_501592 [Bisporella sp. PMI_857]|nr:hypothetical protein B0O99DRAFT_501592 [Bisporella sp. PMI_857]